MGDAKADKKAKAIGVELGGSFGFLTEQDVFGITTRRQQFNDYLADLLRTDLTSKTEEERALLEKEVRRATVESHRLLREQIRMESNLTLQIRIENFRGGPAHQHRNLFDVLKNAASACGECVTDATGFLTSLLPGPNVFWQN